jgi:hypothetical protein
MGSPPQGISSTPNPPAGSRPRTPFFCGVKKVNGHFKTSENTPCQIHPSPPFCHRRPLPHIGLEPPAIAPRNGRRRSFDYEIWALAIRRACAVASAQEPPPLSAHGLHGLSLGCGAACKADPEIRSRRIGTGNPCGQTPHARESARATRMAKGSPGGFLTSGSRDRAR